MKSFYLIWNEARALKQSDAVHESLDSALDKVEELSVANPNETYTILKSQFSTKKINQPVLFEYHTED